MKYDRSLNDLLFNAAWQSIKEMFQAVLPGATPGAVLTVQTAGESLNFNVPMAAFPAADSTRRGIFTCSITWTPIGSPPSSGTGC
jgi:hypothetical protein